MNHRYFIFLFANFPATNCAYFFPNFSPVVLIKNFVKKTVIEEISSNLKNSMNLLEEIEFDFLAVG